MADIVLINPKFEVSYWGMEYALPYIGKQANLPVAALPLLAALTPEGHMITLIDENVEPIDFDRCARADIVGVTGMSVQRYRMTEILTKLKARGCFTIVGGPWVTVQEDYFDDLADVIFIGEAEETWPRFLADWHDGRHAARYEQAEKTDMTRVPVPRFDLLKMQRYAFGSLQFSRGCPFQCEFCYIIITFGRRPRLKTSAQVVAELEAIRRTGQKLVFIVDDNLIGAAKKFQNVRAGGTMLDKVHRIQDAGMEAWCGMIMGFDSDDLGIFDRQVAFIQQARIPFAMTGLLHAIPKTPLYQRVLAEGRLDLADRPEFVTNIRPLKMSPEELRDGYLRVLTELYDPENYFDRTEALFLRPDFEVGTAKARPDYWRKRRLRYAWTQAKMVLPAIGFFLRLIFRIEPASLRREYLKRLWRFLKVHRRPGLTLFYLFHIVMHYHL